MPHQRFNTRRRDEFTRPIIKRHAGLSLISPFLCPTITFTPLHYHNAVVTKSLGGWKSSVLSQRWYSGWTRRINTGLLPREAVFTRRGNEKEFLKSAHFFGGDNCGHISFVVVPTRVTLGAVGEVQIHGAPRAALNFKHLGETLSSGDVFLVWRQKLWSQTTSFNDRRFVLSQRPRLTRYVLLPPVRKPLLCR